MSNECFSKNTIPSNDSWQIASSRRSARNARQFSQASLQTLDAVPVAPVIEVVTSIASLPLSSAPVAETSTVDSQSSSISLDARLSTDVDTFSASPEAPVDVTMTDMQRRFIAPATLRARSLSSKQLEIRIVPFSILNSSDAQGFLSFLLVRLQRAQKKAIMGATINA